MQVSVEQGNGLERRMTVALPREAIEQEIDKRLGEMSRHVRIAGFRPGRVPMKVMRQRYLGSVINEIVNDQISSTFPAALAEQQLVPAAQPQFEPMPSTGAEGGYGYVATFEVLPSIELVSLAGRSIKRPRAEVTDADVEAMIEHFRRQRQTWVDVDRPAQTGDRVRVDYVGSVDGEAFEGASATGQTIEIGRGTTIAGFDDALVGLRAGDEKGIDLEFPEDHRLEQVKGKAVHFDVKVEAVEEAHLPDIDADFVRSYGIESGEIESLVANTRSNMERELEQRLTDRIRGQVMDVLLETHPIDVPNILVKNEIEALQAGMGGRNEPALLNDPVIERTATRRVALGLIIGEVVSANRIEVDQQRVQSKLEALASAYEDPQQIIQHYSSKPEHLEPIRNAVLEEQVIEWVMNQVDVVDEPLRFSDFVTMPD